jgi:hypothetical protein
MSRVSRDQLSFSSGEISPLLRARIDYQRFQTGMASAAGWLPLRQGGFTRAPGTIFRGYTRNNAKARLISFEFAKNDALTLEFTAGFMRIWRYGALVLQTNGSPYELAHSYTEADLATLQWVQSADVIYIVGGSKPIQRLSRFALDDWTIEDAPIENGPFRIQNLNENRTVQASAISGTITLTSSHNLFTANHVGSLLSLEPEDYPDIPVWTGDTTVEPNFMCRYDGRSYRMVEGDNTGVNPPMHKEGIEMTSGNPLVKWEFMSDGRGIVKITAVASATSATATVLKRLPVEVVNGSTYRWSEGAWSKRYGFPSSIEIYDQRLIAAGSSSEPRSIWFSVLGDYADFEPGIEADSSFSYTIAGGSSQNKILWLKAGLRGLHVGALGEEYSVRGNDNEAISATNAYFGFDSSFGSKEGTRPIAPDGRPIFISKDGRRAIEIAYDFQADANRAAELSLPSEHLGAVGFEEVAWQSVPLRIAWWRRGNGSLAAMVYDPTEEVLGWAPIPVAGGAVEAMAVSTGADGTTDTLTLVTERTIGDAQVRMV